jgi:hypothetical protein
MPWYMAGDEESQPVSPLRTPHPLSSRAAKTWLKLHQPLTVAFEQETPLEDAIKAIQATVGDKDGGLPAYLDPIGLQEAEKAPNAPVQFPVKGLPLAASLTRLLHPLGLAFYVDPEGLLVVTGQSGESFPRDGAPVSAEAAKTWLALHQRADVRFAAETPLDEVLGFIKKAAAGPEGPAPAIYVDPRALKAAGQSLKSPVTLDLERVSLADALTLVTQQLGLVYRVLDNGIVAIRDAGDDIEEAEALPIGHGIGTLRRLNLEVEEEKLKSQLAELRAKRRTPQAKDRQ